MKENINYTLLRNGVRAPKLIQGLPLIMGLSNFSQKDVYEIIKNSLNNNIWGFDTSHDYGKSEEYIGHSIRKMISEGILIRENVFITSKIGNAQQEEGNIELYVDRSLKTLGLEYLDLMLLHWPYPGYIDNWEKLVKVYQKGKIKAIGIANAKIYHLEAIKQTYPNFLPQVLQTEIHPFNTCEVLREYCKINQISLQACSSLCLMIPMVKENPTLHMMRNKYNKSIAQIMLKWSLQSGISPVFRAFKKEHINEIKDLMNFDLSINDMNDINKLNLNYRYHPESINCPGF